MKKLFFTLIISFMAAITMAQVPQLINYQAVARNNAGAALANQTIHVRLSILKNAVMQYSETRQVTTNLLGLFNVQIGAPNPLSSTGTLSSINWLNNAAPGYVLKVELDLTTGGTFTDMGTQPLVSVPFSLAADKASIANEVTNIATRPIDVTTAPVVGSKLMWDGSFWTPVKDTIINISTMITSSIANGGPTAPWVFPYTPTTITVNGSQTITGTFTGALGHGQSSYIPVEVGMCYQNIAGGSITEFSGPVTSPEFAILQNTTAPRTQVTATGAIKLPAGTYRIGMAVKNKSALASAPLNNNSYVNGFIEVNN